MNNILVKYNTNKIYDIIINNMNCKTIYLCIIFCVISYKIQLCKPTKIMLSIKIENKTQDYLDKEYKLVKSYNKFLTLTSVAVYKLNKNGYMIPVKTNPHINATEYQKDLSNIGYTALPLLYCDSTWGLCSPLSEALESVIKREDQFIKESINIAKKNGWAGYAIDFEMSDNIDINIISKFMIKWTNELFKNKLQLNIWIGGPVPYNMNMLYMIPNINFITMYTYNSGSYEGFIMSASMFLDGYSNISLSYNYSNIGLGILADEMLTDNDMLVICKWCTSRGIGLLSIFSDSINAVWHENLKVCME